jgi:WD40 repeat protein
VCFVVTSSGFSQDAPPTYWKDVRPVLRKSCTVCHNPRQLDEKEISGGLALDTYDKVLKWKGKALVTPGKAAASPLYQVLVTADTEKRMPLGANALPADAVAIVKRWIDAGAPEGERPAETVVTPPRKTRKLDVTLKGTTASVTLKIGPLSPVVALAFSPDGNLLAAGSYGRVTLWDLTAGTPARTLTSVLGAVNDLKFSPDGTLLAVAGGQPSAKGDLRLFTTADGKLRHVLPGHDDVVACVAFRADGKQLASASYDRTVRTWDVESAKLLATFTHHSDFAHAVAFSTDGKGLFSGSKDRSVRLVDAGTGAGKFTFGDRDEDVLSVAAHPDGGTVVASGMQPFLSWWNAATGEKVRSAPGHRGAVYEVAFDRKGARLVSGGADGTLKLWNGKAGTLERNIEVGSLVYAAAITADGRRVAAGSFDGLVRVYDAATGRHLITLLSSSAGWLAQTPAGLVNGDAALLKEARWSASGKFVSADAIRRALTIPPK